MNPLESFSVDTTGKASDGSWLCEVCGDKATVMVCDGIEGVTAPGWKRLRPYDEHPFCEAHRRLSREYNEQMEIVG